MPIVTIQEKNGQIHEQIKSLIVEDFRQTHTILAPVIRGRGHYGICSTNRKARILKVRVNGVLIILLQYETGPL
jgi:hypothetical protein